MYRFPSSTISQSPLSERLSARAPDVLIGLMCFLSVGIYCFYFFAHPVIFALFLSGSVHDPDLPNFDSLDNCIVLQAGAIPSELGVLVALKTLYLFSNKLSGKRGNYVSSKYQLQLAADSVPFDGGIGKINGSMQWRGNGLSHIPSSVLFRVVLLGSSLPYNTDDSTHPLNNTPPYISTPGYVFLIVFRPSRHHRGYIEYHTPFERTPERISNSKVSHPVDTIHPKTTRTGMDTGTNMEATAAPHHSGPIEPGAWTPRRYLLLPCASNVDHVDFFGSTPSTGTGTGTATPAVAQTPTTGTSTPVKLKKLGQQRPTLQPQGLRPRQQLQICLPLKHPAVCRGLFTLHSYQRYSELTPLLSHPLSPDRACSHSLATDVPLSPPLAITPHRYHTPQLRGSRAWCVSPGVR